MREKILFNDDWLFHLGDIDSPLPKDKGPLYMQSKTETMLWGPASRHYNGRFDSYDTTVEMETEPWDAVTLPHDYIISQAPDKKQNNTLGYFKYENAWYRKEFFLGERDKEKRLTLYFEGVATHATVYVNGCILKRNFCGYNSFEVDITDVAKFGTEKNVLAVYVETNHHEGWWYEGAGIYRHVWLCKTNPVAIDLYGVFVAPYKKEDDSWDIQVETTVRNDSYQNVIVRAVSTVLNKDGNPIATLSGNTGIPLREKGVAKYSANVKNPVLWDVDNPYQYTLKTDIYVNEILTDSIDTRFGFRYFETDADKGFFLNGRPLKIKGLCAHQDFGLTGKAVADNVHRYKAKLMKEMGANGFRTSHYPHSEAFMDALDDLGFIVMNEARWFSSAEDSLNQLEMLIKRDRNRPSVFFWSLGNEEPHHITEEGRRICKAMMALTRKSDPTRPVMTAVSNDPDIATVYDDLDVIGINYNLEKYDKIHSTHPKKAILSSECCATGTTRGWYDESSPEKGYIDAYDKDTNNWFRGRENTWKFIMERPWVMGAYQWTAFEHRGETVWPRLCSQSGAIDLYLQKKDAFYQNQSHWLTTPMVHLLPHWNFKGREGEPIKVFAYTNCEELELFLNGKSLGVQKIEPFGHGEWIVNYVPGKIEVVAKNNGETVAKDCKETTSQPVALKLKLENEVTANGRDVAIISCYCVDSNGLEVPTACPFVRFHANSAGKIIGTGSDISDHTPVTETDRKMRAGRITVAVAVGKEGPLKVYATSENLIDAVLTIKF